MQEITDSEKRKEEGKIAYIEKRESEINILEKKKKRYAIAIISLAIFDVIISILLGIFFCPITLIDIWLPLFSIATAIMMLLLILWSNLKKDMKEKIERYENWKKRKLTPNS